MAARKGRKRRDAKGAAPRGRGGDAAFRVVFSDPDILVVDKAPGALSATPPGSDEPSVFRALRREAKAKGGECFILHRLDRGASGLLVFARTLRAFHALKEDFRSKAVKRSYLAVVEGEMRDAAGGLLKGTIQGFLKEDARGRMRPVQARRTGAGSPSSAADEARLAVTHYETLAAARGRSLVEVRIETGRKHQIRAHLASAGHPVAGDSLYDAPDDPCGRLMLHAASLAFRHPGGLGPQTFRSPAPAGFYRLAGAAVPDPGPGTAPSGRRESRVPEILDTGWGPSGPAYDRSMDAGGGDHHRDVLLPGVLRLLAARPGWRVLDLACGPGVASRALAALGAQVVAVDSAESMIAAARRHGGDAIDYRVLDVRDLSGLRGEAFDGALCLMALMNVDPLSLVFDSLGRVLAPGAPLVAAILHPAFRSPRQTSWGFESRGGGFRQYRRVDGYLSPGEEEIVMNPGVVARGARPVTTWTFHRPLQAYVRALGEAGFVVEAIEEWPSLRATTGSSARAAEENRARREIPLFLAFRARLDRSPG